MTRIMALDVGEKRIGVALSDPLGLTAQGLTVVHRRSPAADVAALAELVRAHEVTLIVVGLPRRMSGAIGAQAENALAFAALLRESLAVPVETWDERLTTRAAERMLVAGDLSRARRRQVVDKVAAALILQGYLDARRARRGAGGEDEPCQLK